MKSKIISSVRLLGSGHEYQKNNFKIVSKKLFVLALLIVGTTIVAQEKNRKQQENAMEQFTPEQESQLMLKKMTLELDLTEAQQKEMGAFISDKIAKKEAMKAEMKAQKEKGVKPTNDERFTMHMKMLDEQIATKKSMQKILNAKQFEKWASMKEKHNKNHQRNQKGDHHRKPQRNPERKG
jgi:protein CpxP